MIWYCRLHGKLQNWYDYHTKHSELMLMHSQRCSDLPSAFHWLWPSWILPVKLPWIFPGAPLIFNGAPGNIQGNLTGMDIPAFHATLYLALMIKSKGVCCILKQNDHVVTGISCYLYLFKNDIICILWQYYIYLAPIILQNAIVLIWYSCYMMGLSILDLEYQCMYFSFQLI